MGQKHNLKTCILTLDFKCGKSEIVKTAHCVHCLFEQLLYLKIKMFKGTFCTV